MFNHNLIDIVKNTCFILLTISLLFGCSSEGKKQDALQVPDSVINEGILEISNEAMQDIIQNISSPVEIAAKIKASGIPFSKKYLAPTDKVSSYNTNLQQSIALGIFGADLGYLNMYNKTGQVLDYISSIKKLADYIKVGQFFDFSTLKRLATNNTNLDSLMYISVHSFNQMDDYLRKNNRGNLSALIIAGVWLEGVYMISQVATDYPDPEMSEKVGEQKIILGDLMLILKNYSKDPNFTKYLEDFEKIREVFRPVKISYEMGEPEAVEQDGMLVIIQNEKSIVHITDEQLALITKTVNDIRNKLINN